MKSIHPHSPLQESVSLELVLDSLLSNTSSHIYWKNTQGIYLGCNEAQAKSLGLPSARDVIGKSDFDLPWDRALAKRFYENDLAVLQSGQPKSIEESTVINGLPATVISLKLPLKDKAGHICGILGISLDVTEQKRTEKSLIQAKEALESANHTQQAFLDNMRHDLRTPLSGIVGCAEIIKDLSTDPHVHEYATHLLTSSQALNRLLNDVLAFIKGSPSHLLTQPVELAPLMERLIALNQAKAAQKALTLTLHIDPRIPSHLLGDPVKIERILLELLTNALNFTLRGGVTVKAELAKEEERCVIIKLTVEDTGIGIPLERQSEVFTRFKRLTPASQGLYPGAGLGLAIIKQLIDDIDGELYFESQAEHGSRFTCVVSLKKALLPPPSANKPDPTEDKAQTASLSILIVEDSLIAATVATQLLSRLGHQVEVVEKGQDALTKVQQTEFDLILLDIGLPDISGIEVAKQIREKEAGSGKRVRIVALTAHVEEEHYPECLEAGIDKVVNKPLTQALAKQILDTAGT